MHLNYYEKKNLHVSILFHIRSTREPRDKREKKTQSVSVAIRSNFILFSFNSAFECVFWQSFIASALSLIPLSNIAFF